MNMKAAQKQLKPAKPLWSSDLYAVLKIGNGSYAVVLNSNHSRTQFSSASKDYAISWAQENSQ